jgi:DNA-directed RNA polymerase specialized sigma subunit
MEATSYSRQYRWQLKKRTDGLCGICGKEKLKNNCQCLECHKKAAKRQKVYMGSKDTRERKVTAKFFNTLTDKEKSFIFDYYVELKTLKEIASLKGFKLAQVRYVIDKARKRAEKEGAVTNLSQNYKYEPTPQGF